MDTANGFTSVNGNPAPPITNALTDTTNLPHAAPTPTTIDTLKQEASSTGQKRKRSPKSSLKFYAVRIGKEPGIYHSWAECLDQVRGWPKAAFKSFTSLTEAQAFVDGDEQHQREAGTTGYAGGGGSSTGKFYAVREGRVPGVYTSWPEVLEQITGWKGPKHRVFKTRAEAEMFVNEGRDGNGAPAQSLTNGEAEGLMDGGTPDTQSKSKKAKINKRSSAKDVLDSNPLDDSPTGGEYSPGSGPLPLSTTDGFDPSITLDTTTGHARYKTAPEHAKTKYQASRPILHAPIRIYTDGSTLSNGQVKSIGGVGVYFGPRDRRNISEPLSGSKQTNQRAELTAILRALEVAPKDRMVVIYSDSKYAISCVTEWFQKWRSNGWLNSSNKPVENKDLVTKIIDMLDERLKLNAHRTMDYEDEDEVVDGEARGPWEKGPAGVKFTWVKGHAKDEGNTAADELAVNGARVARELGEDVVLD